MLPQSVIAFFAANQEILWFCTLVLDLSCTIILYRLFGKAGLQVAIAVAILLANLQGPKLTIIFGLQTSLGVIFYSSIFFATDVLSENYGRAEANKAVRMGFAVSVIVLLMMSISLLYLPSSKPETAEFSSLVISPRCVSTTCHWTSTRFRKFIRPFSEISYRCLSHRR